MGAVLKVLVVGLGSMGKRRVRNLQALGHSELAGFDLRQDRQREVADKYGIAVFDSFESALATFKPDALVISTAPDQHMAYAWAALERGLSCFIEASVVDSERIKELAAKVEGTGVVMAASCTMRYYPGPKLVKSLLLEGAVGKPLNINYQTGQYLPDWHPWERIEDFYVSRRETGGCREIVPFELTWLDDVFGPSAPLACVKAKLTDINADIDDIYHCLLCYPNGVLANMTVEVISRPKATRELRVLGTEGELVFSADENCVRTVRLGEKEWTRHNLGKGTVEAEYINPEEPYIAEIADFVAAVEARDPSRFPNSLLEDVRVLETLQQLERLAEAIR